MRLFAGTPFDIPPTCDRCNALASECQCAPEPESQPLIPPHKQRARVAVENRKRGKRMTVIRGLDNNSAQLADLLTQLKNHCGGGGTIRDGNLEIQGSHLERVSTALLELGYRVG